MTSLIKLGFRRQHKPNVALLFIPPPQPKKSEPRIKPDVDHDPGAERTPQGAAFAGMWIDEFANYGNINNPLASPMESGV